MHGGKKDDAGGDGDVERFFRTEHGDFNKLITRVAQRRRQPAHLVSENKYSGLFHGVRPIILRARILLNANNAPPIFF